MLISYLMINVCFQSWVENFKPVLYRESLRVFLFHPHIMDEMTTAFQLSLFILFFLLFLKKYL